MACSDADCQATAHADLLYKGRQGKARQGRKEGRKERKNERKKKEKKTSLEASKQDELPNIICKQQL